MTINSQAYVTSNSVSTISTLVIYLVLKSPVWTIQWTVLAILLGYFLCFIFTSDDYFISGLLEVLARDEFMTWSFFLHKFKYCMELFSIGALLKIYLIKPMSSPVYVSMWKDSNITGAWRHIMDFYLFVGIIIIFHYYYLFMM